MSELTMLPPPTGGDERLMAQIQAREAGGLEALHAQYSQLVRSLGMGVLHNSADAEDLVQEVFLTVWTRAGTYDAAKGRPLPWLCTLTRRRAIDRLRRRECYLRMEERFVAEVEEHGEGWWCNVHEDMAQTERCALLSAGLAELPEAQREVLLLAYGQELSQREIAEQTGLPLGTIKTRIMLGLRKLAAFLHGQRELLRPARNTVSV